MSSRDAGPGGSVLLGRAEECATVDGVLGQARAGTSRVLLVAGEPGVGKSALLEYAAESASASGFQVVRGPTSRWPASWRTPPNGPGPAAGWPRRRRSWSARPR